jgi:hypothetical protein
MSTEIKWHCCSCGLQRLTLQKTFESWGLSRFVPSTPTIFSCSISMLPRLTNTALSALAAAGQDVLAQKLLRDMPRAQATARDV